MPISLSGSLSLTGSLTVSGSMIYSGSVVSSQPITASAFLTTGTITAQTLVVSTISSSVEYASGSNIFGSSQSNRQTFTGSLYITGSVASFSGCVGIGTTIPTRQLFVNDTAFFDNAGSGTTTNPSIAIGSTSLGISYLAGSNMALLAGGTTKMYISASGNVGIGSNTPKLPLTFADSLGQKILFNDNPNNYSIGLASSVTGADAMMKFIAGCIAAGDFGFYNSSNLRMLITGAGNVGIGTSSPCSKLSVNGAIESLTDPGGEGGQVMLRGTTYQYGLDNFSGCSFRIFREDDGTGANGFTIASFSKCGNIGLRTNQSIGATDNYGSIPNNSFTTFNVNGAGGDNSIGFISFGARRMDANCGAVRMWAHYHTNGANGYSSILGRDEGGIFISNTQSGVECIINCSGGAVCYSIRYINLMSSSALAGI